MDNTVLLPIEGKSKFKFKGLSVAQIKVLKENRNNIFKALASFGGAYLAYETYQSVINITAEEWKELLPDELERLLAPFLQENIDIEECLPDVEIYETIEPEIIDDYISVPEEKGSSIDHTGKAEDILEDLDIDRDLIEEVTEDEKHTVIDKEMSDYINSDDFLNDLNDDSATEVIINDDFVENAEDIIFEEDSTLEETVNILEEHGIDSDLIEETVEKMPEIDEELMSYIESNDILIDLNEDSAEDIIINNEYIDSDEEIFISDEWEYEANDDDYDDYEDHDNWDDNEDFDDIDLNDIPDNL